VNVAFFDHEVAARLGQDFEQDLVNSIPLTTERLRNEPLPAQALGDLSWLVRREE